MTYAPTWDGDTYAAPYPPRLAALPHLKLSLMAAVIAVNLCAAALAWRVVTLPDLDISDKGAGVELPVILPEPPANLGRLAVLDAPQYIPAGKYVPVKAELTGYEAAGVVDAIDAGNSVAMDDNPAPACIACDTLGRREDVDIIPATENDGTGEPAAPVQPIPYTWDDTPAN